MHNTTLRFEKLTSAFNDEREKQKTAENTRRWARAVKYLNRCGVILTSVLTVISVEAAADWQDTVGNSPVPLLHGVAIGAAAVCAGSLALDRHITDRLEMHDADITQGRTALYDDPDMAPKEMWNPPTPLPKT